MEVTLDNGQSFLIDKEDLHYIKMGHCYIPRKYGGYDDRVRQDIREKDGKLLSTFLHRTIMGLGRNDKRIVDHIDRNGRNNMRSNLRICTPSQNNMNRCPEKIGKFWSKYKGVSYDKRQKLWSASIGVDGRKKTIGWYKTEKKAAKSYNSWAKFVFGDFAFLNKIED